MIKRVSICLLFLAGCITTMNDDMFPEQKSQPKYKVGQCFNVFDPETGRSRSDDIVRVEAVYDGIYWYRWWLPQKEWALDLSSGIGKYQTFERMTVKVDCP